MIKNVKNTESIKVEGKTEDIELKLDNGKRIYAQAKSNQHPNCDFRNVISALTKSLKALSKLLIRKMSIYFYLLPIPIILLMWNMIKCFLDQNNIITFLI